ncbi:MAG: hypothetical protein ACM3JJ_05410 [Hyphomicrobiales bacterium]
MPPRNLVRAFLFLWWTLGVALLVLSVGTLAHAIHGAGLMSHHVALLAFVETVSALAFLVPATNRYGAAGLLLVFAVAMLLHGGMHEFRWDLLVYGAAVIFVAVHGPLTREQWTLAFGRREQGA